MMLKVDLCSRQATRQLVLCAPYTIAFGHFRLDAWFAKVSVGIALQSLEKHDLAALRCIYPSDTGLRSLVSQLTLVVLANII